MGRIIFKKDKYEDYMVNKIGISEFLLLKLNAAPHDAWSEVLDGQDITDNLSILENNGERLFQVMWKTIDEISFGAQLYCYIKEMWCDFVEV
jgi:hypothetical protein